MTEWRDVKGLPGYAVSADGRVRGPKRELALMFDRYGYAYINTTAQRQVRHHKVHRLVCEAFHGPCPDGHEAGHLDGNSRNNSADNLRWVTHSENVRHQVAHGTIRGWDNKGEKHPRSKLRADQVEAIRSAEGVSTRALAERYGVNQSQIVRIRNRERWAA